MKAMILAAGLGSRLRPYTGHTPKALFTINQRPCIGLILDRLHAIGCERVIINTHHHHRQIEAFIAGRKDRDRIITRYEPDLLGTGGGIRNIKDLWETGPLLVINADIVSDIDLAAVCAHHQRHSAAATLVMHDHASFNTVWVNNKSYIASFESAPAPGGACKKMAFTGIHVLNPEVLDHLPGHKAASIIDAYRRLLAHGGQIRAYIAGNHYWRDIGAPESYQAAVFDAMAPAAFEKAFGSKSNTTIQSTRLHGDGSDRRWHRLHDGRRSLILADHGIRRRQSRQEVDAFIDIGLHLKRTGAPVPRLVLWDSFAGVVFMEDCGDLHLQQAALARGPNQRLALYQTVIDRWLDMAFSAKAEFDPRWTFQSACYDREVILEKEGRYFSEAFLRAYLGWPAAFDDLSPEVEQLADGIDQTAIMGFMHRDLQSRNVMIRDGAPCFIDFQGGRMGPVQYDLAALLIDPYVALPHEAQQFLLAFAADLANQRYGAPLDLFRRGFAYCAITRNLQILGAFAFLSRVKGKTAFERYIPDAVASLKRNLYTLKELSLPKLTAAADQAARQVATPKPRSCQPLS